jgi:hypothetical protein
MASFTEIWFSLAQPGKPLPFMLIDCAGFEDGAAQLPRHIFSRMECLFTGNLATELADVAPYLGQLKSFSTEVAKTVEDLLARHIGTLILPEVSPNEGTSTTFSQLHLHFRKFNMVNGPDNKQLFFRYYDPRVIMNVLSVLNKDQIEEFFRHVDSIVLTIPKGQTIRCQYQTGTLAMLRP